MGSYKAEKADGVWNVAEGEGGGKVGGGGTQTFYIVSGTIFHG